MRKGFLEEGVLEPNNEERVNFIFTQDDGTYVGTDITKYPYKIIKNELNITDQEADILLDSIPLNNAFKR